MSFMLVRSKQQSSGIAMSYAQYSEPKEKKFFDTLLPAVFEAKLRNQFAAKDSYGWTNDGPWAVVDTSRNPWYLHACG